MNSIKRDYKKTRLLSRNSQDLADAACILRNGGIVALPTETVYGLAANALCDKAIVKVFEAKNRPSSNPLILHVKDSAHAKSLLNAKNVTPLVEQRFQRLASSFWPGPLTMVAEKAAFVPKRATGGLTSVAIRVPNQEETLSILAQLNFPLVMPSANLSTRPSPTSAQHVLTTLNGRIDAVVDGGHCLVGIESSVVKIDSEMVVILRHGVISAVMLEECLSEPIYDHSRKHYNQPLSPGQAFLHYSPAVKSVIVCNREDAAVYWQTDNMFLAKKNDFLFLKERHGSRSPKTPNFILSDEPHLYAAELYSVLYKCEDFPEKKLVIVMPSDHQENWSAIKDRLIRSMR